MGIHAPDSSTEIAPQIPRSHPFQQKRRPQGAGSPLVLTTEANNLFAMNSMKYSGICNKKAFGISSDGAAVTFSKKRAAAVASPGKTTHTVTMKRNFKKMAKAVGKEVSGGRKDLKKAALARLSAVHKSLRVAKAANK